MSQHINPTPKQTAVDSVNSKIGNVGSTDLQAQITSLNSKTAETKSIIQQSNYSLLGSVSPQVVKCGNIAEFHAILQCDSVNGNYPGTVIFENLPIPYGNAVLFFAAPCFDTGGVAPLRLALIDGTLYARFGERGKAYDVNIVYIIA